MLFKDLLDSFTPVPWRSIFEYTKSLKRFLTRIALVATGSINKESAVVCLVIAKRVLRMYRQSGPLSTSLYLKQCSVSLMRYYAGSSKDVRNKMAGASVSLSRAGIPTIIPVHHRQIISARGERGDYLVHLYLSLFSLCRIIKLAKPVGKSTFSSITTPVEDMDMVREVMGEVKSSAKKLLSLYLPWLQTLPLKPGFKFVPTWKSTPNDDRQFRENVSTKVIPTIFTSLKYEIATFARYLRLIHSWEGVFSPGILFKWGHTLFPFDTGYNTRYANEALTFYEGRPGQVFDDLACAFDRSGVDLLPGRLAQSLEGAGKRRLFVIGNYFKQRLLYPIHAWAMSVLRRIPMDGTFFQERPIQRLVMKDLQTVFSFDLSSATDRWPVPIIHDLVACIFGQTMASCIVNGSLALNACSLKNIIGKQTNVCFVVGQPLGYYGSWALFSLTHHFMVWLAADRVNPNRKTPFRDYALLGDDIVIANKEVAHEYRKYLDRLQVKISDAKSITSERGAFEFAKQFWVGRTNLSPVSAKAVLASYSVTGIVQLARKYKLSTKTCLKLAGAGYRVKARMDTPYMAVRYKRISALCHKQLVCSVNLPLEWWIGRGKPISPFLKGVLVDRVRSSMKLKQLCLVPEERFWGEGEIWTTENQLYRNWLTDWLKYLQWFVSIQVAPDPNLVDLFSPPVISYTWKRKEDDVLRHRLSWSLLYKLYDMAEGKDTGWCPTPITANWPMLEEWKPSHPTTTGETYHTTTGSLGINPDQGLVSGPR
ncbi:RNA-dependent RNA polymerase [Oxybasis rubra mitovirus 1]|uniref:RNA-dependent RNA polymerase n=1 Tax=Oxybasis rubra mitovirus 1 TaxID=2080462 RepID=A0ABM9WIS7_9VIRU|nr:RNA-dependent RNA polymerase [Oxybasis rubra mitovirus 1]DAB41745.1 TPA_inf: RNA-dependent RNA polymerase [Oxybasis rubra mitovirus 1]